MAVSITVKVGMASRHIKNAKLFRDESKRIESIYSDGKNSEVPKRDKNKHSAFTVSGIYSVVSAVDSYANEFIKDIKDEYERIESGGDRLKYEEIDDNMVRRIAEYSDQDYDDPLDKVSSCRTSRSLNSILEIMGADEFSSDEAFQENFDLICTMRNKLSHHKPKHVGGSSKDPENAYNIEKDLENKNFELNPLLPAGNPFFPQQVMSSSCLDWSIRNATKLVDEFSNKVNIDKNLS